MLQRLGHPAATELQIDRRRHFHNTLRNVCQSSTMSEVKNDLRSNTTIAHLETGEAIVLVRGKVTVLVVAQREQHA